MTVGFPPRIAHYDRGDGGVSLFLDLLGDLNCNYCDKTCYLVVAQ